MHKTLISFLVLAWSGVAAADWSSGGGFVLKDAHNPWFVQNTRKVTWCLQRDAAHFSVPEEKLVPLVEEVLAYWKAEFARSNQDHRGRPFKVLVATQEFVRGECADDVPLVLQFGTLTPAQRQAIAKPEALVGLAARTDYDVPKLKGKGFVYIAPDSGPAKPDVPMLGDTLPDGFWSLNDANKLKRVLAHELGHVFGVPHRGNEQMLMGENHPEWLLRNGWWNEPRLPRVLNDRYETTYLYCNPHIESLYGTPAGMNCFRLKGDAEHGLVWTVGADETAQDKPFATVKFESYRGDPRTWEELVQLYVPRDHPLFGGHTGYLGVLDLRAPYEITGRIVYEDGRPALPVAVKLWPGSFEISAFGTESVRDILDGRYDETKFVFWPPNH